MPQAIRSSSASRCKAQCEWQVYFICVAALSISPVLIVPHYTSRYTFVKSKHLWPGSAILSMLDCWLTTWGGATEHANISRGVAPSAAALHPQLCLFGDDIAMFLPRRGRWLYLAPSKYHFLTIGLACADCKQRKNPWRIHAPLDVVFSILPILSLSWEAIMYFAEDCVHSH